ncbi:ATP-binding cassette domain-containing protein [Roseibium algae]|uniref:ATP-binding cassette domain-containing protein n=1 Tax=Roseibium algae TaxID=3123038 RepID=A0ABU8TRR3_9HYPH
MTDGLVLDNVNISLAGRSLVEISTTIAAGQVLTVMGDSGSGKSTLLEYVAGFLSAPFQASGKVILNGYDVTSDTPQVRQLGLMFQAPLLFPHMSVLDNLMFGLPAAGLSKGCRAEMAEAALRDVGLEGFGRRDPATLSGGQQTRVALMRLLLAKPKALLLDEPFSSLDQSRRAETRHFVFDMAKSHKLPVLLVSHDPEDAKAAEGEIFTL